MAGVSDHDVRFGLATGAADVGEILDLQAANLETALEADVVASEGFETMLVYPDATTGERWHVIGLDLRRPA